MAISPAAVNEDSPQGATPLDDTSGLIPLYITTRKDLFNAEFQNINGATHKYLITNTKMVLTISWLFGLHKNMFDMVWQWAGKKRIANTNIGADKSQIDTELAKFIGDFQYWQTQNMDKIELSARLHHRLVSIHPFPNGNGRWARLATNVFLKQATGQVVFWPEDELFITTNFRKRYIEALQSADGLDYEPLIALHKRYLQKL